MTVRDDLLARIDIVDVVGRYVSLKRGWKNRLGLCPFHKEKTPSFTVAEDKQIYKCFGCGKGGNAVNFVMEIERIDFRDAMKELARTINFDLTPYQKNPEITEKRQQDREKLKLLNKRAQEYFASQFSWSPAASYIVEKRKLTPETISAFGIGYAPESSLSMIDYLKGKGFTTEDIIQAGLASQGSHGIMPFFRNRVTFPIIDHIGNIVGFGARALLPDQNPKYLNTTETPLYEKSQLLFGLDKARNQIREYGFLIVVEGYMDVIAMHQYGLPLGVATCGTALTTDHIKLLKRHTDQVVLLFDADEAGHEATIRALKVAYHADLYPRAVDLPQGVKDVDERLTTQGSAVRPEELLAQSIDAFQCVMQRRRHQMDLTNPVFRKKFQQEMFEILQMLEDHGIFMTYLEQLWAFLRLTGSEITKEFKIRLKQQKRGMRPESKVSSASLLPDNQLLLAALIYRRHRALLSDHQDLEKSVEMLQTLIPYLPESILHHAVSETTAGDMSDLLPRQVWREQQLQGLTPDKVHLELISFVQKQLHELIKHALKNPSLSSAQKDDLLKMMRG